MAETPARSGPTQITAANTSQTIYTAGGAGTWSIVRSIVITNTGLTEVKVTVGIGTTNTDTAAKRLAYWVPIPVGRPLDIIEQGFVPLLGNASTPDLIYALCDTANVINVTVGMVTGP